MTEPNQDLAAVSGDAAAAEIPRAPVDGALAAPPPHGAPGEALARPLRFFVTGFDFTQSYHGRQQWWLHLIFESDIDVYSTTIRVSVPPDIGRRLAIAYRDRQTLELREVLPGLDFESVDRDLLRAKAYQALSSNGNEREWAFAVRALAAVANPPTILALLNELERLESMLRATLTCADPGAST